MSSLTLQWLRQNTRPYPRHDELCAHVEALLAHPVLARAIRPKTDVYTFNDGRTQLLLCLHGLIPISFRNAAYNIPVNIWIPLDYPTTPPLVYVVPTSDMLISQSVHVDLSGLTTIPYLHNWKSKPEGCNIIALIEALQEHFSLLPPLYAKPRQSQVNPPPPPPLPPPRPLSISHPPPPSPHQQQHRSSAPPGTGQTPPRPPPPPFPLHAPSLVPNNPPPPPPPPTVPQPSLQSPPPVPPPPQGRIGRFQSPTSPTFASTSISISPPPPPFLPPTFLSHAQAPVPKAMVVTPPPPPPQLPAPKLPLPNLMDDLPTISSDPVEDQPQIAPPRPLNPALLSLHAALHQKFTASLQNLSTTHQATLSKLLTLQSDLLKGPPAIADESARLEAVKDVCTAVAKRVDTVVREAEGRIDDIKRRGETSVDELVCSSDVVYNQLIDLVAEDNAIEDTIYHLHRAHNAGRIDLEKFLKTTRALAEEQFMKRALIEKIGEETRLGR